MPCALEVNSNGRLNCVILCVILVINHYHIVHPQKNIFKKGGGLDRTIIFRGIWWERRDDLFKYGGCSFYIQNKLKSEIFNGKKNL